MDEITQKVEDIVEHAPNWSFEYDMSLLELMKMISQNMEQHVCHTSQKLQELSNNVERASIGLDNTANSLTALQFGQQFVESRCQDDDETVANQSEVPLEDAPVCNAEEILKSFFNNNLTMLQNCHEKYAIDMQDSDEEDEITTKTFMFQAKNPYNERLLPHIYNSNLWKESWHVGLAEDTTNDYSGDEASLAYSDSSSSSISAPADNESFESNTGQLSAWTSSASLPQTQQLQQQLTKPMPIKTEVRTMGNRYAHAAGSDTSTSTEVLPSNQAKHIQKTPNQQMPRHEYDLFAALRTTPPPITTPTHSATPTPIHSSTSQKQSASISSSASSKHMPADASVIAVDVSSSTNAQEPEFLKEPIAAQSTIRRKPVNLFDDDEFNNFMSELTGKAQAKTENKIDEAANASATPTTNQPVAQPRSQKKIVDLFADEPPEFISNASDKKPEPVAPRRQKVNLFDDFDDEVTMSSPTFTPVDGNYKVAAKPDATPIATKSLFDDDADVDDFFNVFSNKQKPTTTLTKTNLFDDDDEDDIVAAKQMQEAVATAPAKKVEKLESTLTAVRPKNEVLSKSLFFASDDENNGDLFGGTVNEKVKNSTNVAEGADSKIVHSPPETEVKKQSQLESAKSDTLGGKGDERDNALLRDKSNEVKKQLSRGLFDDENEDDLFASSFSVVRAEKRKDDPLGNDTPKLTTALPIVKQEDVSEELPKQVVSKLKLFEDESDAENDLFIKTETHVATKAAPTEATQKLENKTPSLFDDDAYEEDDLFAKKIPLPKKEQVKTRSTTAAVAPSLFDEKVVSENEIEASSVPAKNVEQKKDLFNSSLFADDDNYKEEEANQNETKLNKSAVESETTKDEEHVQQITNITTNSAKVDAESIEVEPTDTIQAQLVGSSSENNIEETETEYTEARKDNDWASIKDTPKETLNISQDFQSHPDEEFASPSSSSTVPPASYSSLFMDEPPDDSDFFESLSSQSSKRATERIFDDFFEPALPEVPTTTAATTPVAASLTQPTLVTQTSADLNSDYKGIRLFSDLPPDDEYEEPVPDTTATPATKTNDAKRLHSIFYDDFSETMEAVKQQHKPAEIPTKHSFFDDEPPSDDDLFPAVSKPETTVVTSKLDNSKTPTQIHLTKPAGEETATMAITQDVPDNVKPQPEPEIHSNIAALQAKIHAQQSTEPATKADVPSVAKLKTQNLNINVKALLPGAAIKTLPRKSSESTAKVENNATLSVPTPVSAATLSAAESSTNILPSVCKNRVRAPANRRPSTRQARQENYRKSLVIEKEAQSQLHEPEKPVTRQPTTQTKAKDEPVAARPLKSSLSSVQLITPPNISKASNLLFADFSDDENDDLFDRRPVVDKSAPKAPLKRPPDALVDSNNTLPEIPPIRQVEATKTAQKQPPAAAKQTLFASDSDSDDDDLFKSSKKPPKLEVAKTKASESVPKKSASLFSSSSGEDDNITSSIAAKSLKPRKQQSLLKSLAKPVASGGLFSDNDDDDDLFGTGKK